MDLIRNMCSEITLLKLLPHRLVAINSFPIDKMAVISLTIYSDAFS